MNHPFLKFEFPESTRKVTKTKNCLAIIGRIFANYKNSTLFQENELELMGLLDVVDGLIYHYNNFARNEKRQRKCLKKNIEEMVLHHVPKKVMIHECVAYLNRLGQIESLFSSKWFQKFVTDKELASCCPNILALMPLRNKHAAHRSLDKPKGEHQHQLANHASLPFSVKWLGPACSNQTDQHDSSFGDQAHISYTIQISKEGKLNRSELLKNYHSTAVDGIEIFSGNTIWVTFIPTKQHDIIVSEIIRVINKFFSKN